MYSEKDLVKVAKRENNNKRNYLVVNPFQGKHIPVVPSQALNLFKSLAGQMKDEYKNEKLLLVGFAETATAIGAQVAVELKVKYIHTTREAVPGVEYLFFSEEHSHAAEQKLIKNDIDLAVEEGIDRLIFIEDEVTTGKTILNIITLLEKTYANKLKFGVASILNGMGQENLQKFTDRKITLHYLVKTEHSKYVDRAESYAGDGIYVGCDDRPVSVSRELHVSGQMDTRRMVNTEMYHKSCLSLWDRISDEIGNELQGNILVIGTEEFMFPALFVAEKIEKLGNDVRCHSTTRSPITVSQEADYPLHTRYELKSLYDKNRVTYLYDVGCYDAVLIITDAPHNDEEGKNTLVNALKIQNEKIFLVRWY